MRLQCRRNALSAGAPATPMSKAILMAESDKPRDGRIIESDQVKYSILKQQLVSQHGA